MGRLHLLDTMNTFRALWAAFPGRDAAEEAGILARFRDFVTTTPACFERTSQAGHVTGSALVVSPTFDQVLLTLHGKLGLWLQLGGHADGDPEVHQVAYREVREESGLADVRFLAYEMLLGARRPGAEPLPFDFDHHDIPGRAHEPAHVHYDVRYVIVADPAEPLTITAESKDLRWFPLAEARKVTDERSMHRQFDKLGWLKTQLSLQA